MKLYFENINDTYELPDYLRLVDTGAMKRRSAFKPRYSRDGAEDASDSRVESRTIKFSWLHSSGDADSILADGGTVTSNLEQTLDEGWKADIEEILAFFRPELGPFYLIDTDAKLGEGTRKRIKLTDFSENFEDGAIYRIAKPSLTFEDLDAFWEDYSVQSYDSGTLVNGDSFTIDNTCLYEVFIKLTVVSLDDVETFTLTNQTTGVYTLVSNTGFKNGVTLVVDGTGSVALITLDGVNAHASLGDGSGMIQLDPGVNSFTVETPGSVALSIEYRRRFAV